MAFARPFNIIIRKKRVRRLLRLSLSAGVVLIFLAATIPFGLTGTAEAATWDTETVDTGSVGRFSSIALDASGYPHISYFDDYHGGLKYAYKDDTGWHTESVPSSAGVDTSIALDTYGLPHISYCDWNSGNVKCAYKDGTGWHVEPVDSLGSYTSIALDASGCPHISYAYYNGTDYDLKYAYKDGSGWHPTTVDSAGDVGRYTSIALDTSGYPHISYYDATNCDLKYAYKIDTGWHIEAENIDSADSVGRYASMALDTSGYPHISYYDSTNNRLKYAYKDGAGWHTETVGNTYGGCSSIAMDTSNYPHISYDYYDLQYNKLEYAYKDGAGWHTTIVDTGEYVSSYTERNSSIALDANGNPQISYYDANHNSLKYAHTITFPWTHGQFTATTGACAGCHVAHAAQMPNLLKQGPTQTHFCFLCHGDGATSAPYDVKDGYTLSVSGAVYPSTAGGFVYQFVDANGNYAVDAGELKPVTSRHNVWGFVYGDESGAVQDTADKYHWIPGGSNQLTGSGFVCTSCHDPHDGGAVPDNSNCIQGSATTPNPRLLRRSITVQDAAYTSLYVKFCGSWEDNKNKGSYYVTSYDSATSKWCGACHNKLQTDDTGDKAGEGQAIQYFGMWRHPIGSHVIQGTVTDASLATGTPLLKEDAPWVGWGARQVGCLSCHRAHSSAVVMEEGSWAASWPREAADPATGKAQGDTSALLRMDNRGTCYNCHGSGERNCRNDPFYDSLDCSSCHPHTGSGAHPIMGDCNGCHDW